MKKVVNIVLALCLLFGLCTIQSFAEPGGTTGGNGGFYVKSGSSLTLSNLVITPKTAALQNVSKVSAEVDSNKDGYEAFYENSERLAVTYSGAVTAGDHFLILLFDGDGDLPTASSNIKYINQVTATADNQKIEFDVYPILPEEAKVKEDLHLVLTSSHQGFSLNPVYISYASADTFNKAPYVLGDANGDGYVGIKDVTVTLRHVAQIEEVTDTTRLLAMDVLGNDGVKISDVTQILRKVAQIIDSF